MDFKQASLKTLNRNVASGKWILRTPYDPKTGRASIVTASATRGVRNTAGRYYVIEVMKEIA